MNAEALDGSRTTLGPRANVRNWRDVLVVLILVALGISAALVSFAPVGIDDAYISYRVAENLAHGAGAVYNPGERVYGSTTLAWVGLLALGARLSGAPVETVARGFVLFFMAANPVLLYALMRRVGATRPAAVLTAVLLLGAPLYIPVAGMGMETPFYCGVILAAFLAAASEAWLVAGLLAGVCFAIRPDGLAVIGALAAAAWLTGPGRAAEPRPGRPPGRGVSPALVRLAAGFAVIAVPFALLCLSYYGSVLPHTLSAKRLHPLYAGRWWMLQHFATGPGAPVLLFLLLLFIAALARRRATPAHGNARLAYVTLAGTLWLVLYVGAWSAVHIDLYPWYLAAIAPVTALLAGLTLVSAYARWQSRVCRGIVWSLLTLVAAYWAYDAHHELRRFHVYVQQLELPRKRMAELMSTCAEPNRIVGAGAIGLLGYYTPELRIIDYAGLVTPRTVLDDNTIRPDLFAGGAPSFPDANRYLLVAMYTPAISAPDALGWIRRDVRAAWKAERWTPAKRIDARFGATVHLLGATPICSNVQPGQQIQFQILWRFDQPLPSDRLIRYQLTADTGAMAASVDTHGFFRDQRPFADVEAGEAVLDHVNFPVPGETPDGSYELAVTIYPFESYDLAAAFGARDDARLCHLLAITVAHPGNAKLK